MQTIFEAANSIEARLLLGILNQAGIDGHIDGEYLQGGVGELQAFGLVRLKVAAANVVEAREIIRDWQEGELQSNQEPFGGSENEPTPSASKAASRGTIVGVLIGLLIAGVVVIGTIWSPL